MIDHTKAPFPWFGGKSKAASLVWTALGDPNHYVEPFAGSLAVLLNRPHEPNRVHYTETVNDLDGLLVNAWRSIQRSPHETAEACSWPVTEVDLLARHMALVKWRSERDLERLQGDPEWHDARIAGWWLYGICAWIGRGWCTGKGPWHSVNGRAVKQDRGSRGRGNTREPGTDSQRPHLHCDGMGVHSDQLREEHTSLVMPKLLHWFELLSMRLRHVRIVSGDWKRVLTHSAAQTISCKKPGSVGVFLDPPYSSSVRDPGLYSVDDDCSSAVRAWCLDAPEHWRIVLAGFDTEHTSLEARGWTCVEWFKNGFLAGGMGGTSEKGHQQSRERLWLSPSCVSGTSYPGVWIRGGL